MSIVVTESRSLHSVSSLIKCIRMLPCSLLSIIKMYNVHNYILFAGCMIGKWVYAKPNQKCYLYPKGILASKLASKQLG